MIETDRALVEPIADSLIMGHESHIDPASVKHSPHMESRLLDFNDKVKTENLVPPPSAPLPVGDRKIDMSKAFDTRCRHGSSLAVRRGRRCDREHGTASAVHV